MYNNHLRINLKNLLLIINITLALTIIILLFLQAFIFQKQQNDLAQAKKQYLVADLTNLTYKNAGTDLSQINQTQNYKPEQNLPILDQQNSQVLIDQNIISNLKPKIAILVTNLGLNKLSTELSLTLPMNISLGFSPYTSALKTLLCKANEEGHEIYLNLPLEKTGNLNSLSKYTIASRNSIDENLKRLMVILSSQNNYRGLYTNFNEIFNNSDSIIPLIKKLGQDNLDLILAKSDVSPTISNLPNIITSNVLLDEEIDDDSIKDNLKKLIEIAKQKGQALGYSKGYAITINLLKDWLPLLHNEGIDIVPVSTIMK